MVDRLEQEYEGTVKFELMNADTNTEAAPLMQQYGVTAVPTFVFINSDGSQAGKLIGAVPEEQLREQLDALE